MCVCVRVCLFIYHMVGTTLYLYFEHFAAPLAEDRGLKVYSLIIAITGSPCLQKMHGDILRLPRVEESAQFHSLANPGCCH